MTAEALVTGKLKIERANKITSKWGATSAGLDVTFQTINVPNAQKLKNSGPTKTMVKNWEPLKVVFVFASSYTICCRASSSSFSKDSSVISYDLLTSAPSSPTSVRYEHGGLHEPAIVYPLLLAS